MSELWPKTYANIIGIINIWGMGLRMQANFYQILIFLDRAMFTWFNYYWITYSL